MFFPIVPRGTFIRSADDGGSGGGDGDDAGGGLMDNADKVAPDDGAGDKNAADKGGQGNGDDGDAWDMGKMRANDESGAKAKDDDDDGDKKGDKDDADKVKTKTETTKPEGLADQFWDAGKGELKVDDLIKSQADLRKKVSEKPGDRKAPEKFTDYQLTLPDTMDKIKIEADDPVLAAFAKSCHDEGLSQDNFQKIAMSAMEIIAANIPDPVDYEKEFGKLGKNGKDIVRGLKTWVDGFANSGAITKASRDILMSRIGSDASGVRALIELREATGEGKIPAGGGGGSGAMTAEEYYAAVGSKQYDESAAYRNKIDKIGERLFGTDPAASSQSNLGVG